MLYQPAANLVTMVARVYSTPKALYYQQVVTAELDKLRHQLLPGSIVIYRKNAISPAAFNNKS